MTHRADARVNKLAERFVTYLPESEPSRRRYMVIFVADHRLKPPQRFNGRAPRRFAGQRPKMVELPDGAQRYAFEGKQFPELGLNPAMAQPLAELTDEPVRFNEKHRSCWDIDNRTKGMVLDDMVYAAERPLAASCFRWPEAFCKESPEFFRTPHSRRRVRTGRRGTSTQKQIKLEMRQHIFTIHDTGSINE